MVIPENRRSERPAGRAELHFSRESCEGGGQRVDGLLVCPMTAFKSSARPGEVEPGSPTRTCANTRIYGVRIHPAMVKAMRNWLETHELPAIIAGVLGVIVLLAVIFVVGGYWLVTA
jgi:hypothetical protein